MNVPPGKFASLYIRGNEAKSKLIHEYKEYFHSLGRIDTIHAFSGEKEKMAAATAVVQGVELFVPLAELIDLDKEKMRLEKEIKRLEGLEKGTRAKLANQNFVQKAPQNVVAAEKEKLANVVENLKKVRENYEKLEDN